MKWKSYLCSINSIARMRKKLLFFLFSLASGFSFYIFTYIVKKDVLRQFDFDYVVKTQDHISQRLYKVLALFSSTGQAEILLIILVIILVLRRRIFDLFVLLFFILGHFVELFGKVLLDQPKPPFYFYKHEMVQIFPKWYSSPGSSYPSGHAFRAVFIFLVASYLIFKLKWLHPFLRLAGILGVGLWAVFVMLSKVWLGEHWPSDVLGGALLGGFLGFLSLVFL